MPPKRILVIRWKSIGDVVFTLPAVNSLRDNFPDAEIVFLVSEENAFALEGFQAVNQIWTLNRRQLRSTRAVQGTLVLIDLLLQIRRHRFTMAVDLQNYGESALITLWSGAHLRLGYHKNSLRRRAYTHSLPYTSVLHPALQHLQLLRLAGIPEGPVRNQWIPSSDDLAAAQAFLAQRQLDSRRPLVYLQAFTSSPRKDWPLANYLTLAEELSHSGAQILFGGGPQDRRRLVQAGIPPARIIDAPRNTDVALMQASTLVIGGDTGFIHIANALGSRVLLLGRSGAVTPFGHPESVLLSADASMASIPVESVLRKVRSILAEDDENPVR